MLNCLNSPGNLTGKGTDISVWERQRTRLKWQQELLQQHGFFGGEEMGFFPVMSHAPEFLGSVEEKDSQLGELMTGTVNTDSGYVNGWPQMGQHPEVINGPVYGRSYTISRTASCPPDTIAAAAMMMAQVAATDSRGPALSDKLASPLGKDSFRKRKADALHNSKVIAEDESREKRAKGCIEDSDSKITEKSNNNNNNNRSRETSSNTSKENSKVSEVQQKPDYIHVRARRGQATDSHSLAERVRRERISERMKYLQDLVPGCNKITGKAGMLDEIINYVQSLQRQVEFLSMKLATVNPSLDFNIENLFAEEQVMPACAANLSAISMAPEMANPTCLQYNTLQQATSSVPDMGVTPELGFQRTISTPISIPEGFVNSSCFTQIQDAATWDAELQNMYSGELQGSSAPFASQILTGSLEAGNLKMEM